jgi:hypothetical protein
MQRHRGLFLGLALSALLGLMGNQAHAGPLTLSVDLNGVSIFSVSSVAPDQSVTAIVLAVNTALTANGSAYQFTALGAQSNFTGDATGSLQTTFQLNTSGDGTTAAVLSIDTTQSGFLSPVGPGGTLTSMAGGSFISASGSLSYTSNFQGANSPTLVFPVSGTNSYSDNTGSIPIGAIPSGYQLSNHFLINLSKGAHSFLGGTGQVEVSAIPEPASLVILLTGIPVPMALLGLLRLRRKAQA